LSRILATTELNVNKSGQSSTAAAELSTTHSPMMPESARPLGAALSTVQSETSGTNIQCSERGQDLTVEELEEMLKRKRIADKKNQVKADNKEKKTVQTRSTSLQRNFKNKQ
jgi:hypothetical protein